MYTAVFIGHNECYDISAEQLERTIIECIDKSVTVFLNGGQGGFDRMSAGTVHKLKKKTYEYALKKQLIICNLSVLK